MKYLNGLARQMYVKLGLEFTKSFNAKNHAKIVANEKYIGTVSSLIYG